MINLAREAANERGIPEQQVGIFTHHMINQFRMKVLSSWIVKQATKPKINNSGTARMRPNDEALRVDADNANPRLKELETNEKLFFLDNHFKDMLIYTEIYGEKPVPFLATLPISSTDLILIPGPTSLLIICLACDCKLL